MLRPPPPPQVQKVLVLENNVEVAQFQSNSPRYIPLSEELWKALVKLPSVYDYAAYRKLLERFGTHYLSEGSLGGAFKVVAKIDQETERYMSEDPLTSVSLSLFTLAAADFRTAFEFKLGKRSLFN